MPRAAMIGWLLLALLAPGCASPDHRAAPSPSPPAATRHWIAEDRWPASGSISVVYGFEGWDGERPVFRVEVFHADGQSARTYYRVEPDDSETRWTAANAPFAPLGDPDAGDRAALPRGELLILDGESRLTRETLTLVQGKPQAGSAMTTRITMSDPAAPSSEANIWQGLTPPARLTSAVRSPLRAWLLFELLAEDQTHLILAPTTRE